MTQVEVRIERFDGDRDALRWSFLAAESSGQLLETYFGLGGVWVARGPDGAVVGHVQAVERSLESWEIPNIAVAAAQQGQGIGRLLVERVIEEARSAGATRLELATATAAIDNLRFYQRCGFRFSRIVRDWFVPERGYEVGAEIDGIPMRDQIWFERDL